MTYQYNNLQNENLDVAIMPTKEYRKLLCFNKEKKLWITAELRLSYIRNWYAQSSLSNTQETLCTNQTVARIC